MHNILSQTFKRVGLVWALRLYGATQTFLLWPMYNCTWHTCTLRAFYREKLSRNSWTDWIVSAFIRIRSDTHRIFFQFFFFVWPMYRHVTIIIFHTIILSWSVSEPIPKFVDDRSVKIKQEENFFSFKTWLKWCDNNDERELDWRR